MMGTNRILIVDDRPDLLNMMRMKLASWGYDVITASSGKEALKLVRKNKGLVDMVILDIVMPDLDGIQTLKRLRRFDKKTPVFMLTGYPTEENLKDARDLGVSGFISKGPEFIESARIIKAALGSAREEAKRSDKKAR